MAKWSPGKPGAAYARCYAVRGEDIAEAKRRIAEAEMELMRGAWLAIGCRGWRIFGFGCERRAATKPDELPFMSTPVDRRRE